MMSGHRMANLTAIQGNITTMEVDAVVKAAKPSLLGGDGLDGVIHRAAGPALLDMCRRLGTCRTGDAKITRGYHLPARFIIHTVVPIWNGGTRGEGAVLQSCYRRSLELVVQRELRSVAFSPIGTGVFGFPLRRAAEIAVSAVRTFLEQPGTLQEVTFCCASARDCEVYRELLAGRSAR
jgi:O-acetyl-ADP-ribose deacetylase